MTVASDTGGAASPECAAPKRAAPKCATPKCAALEDRLTFRTASMQRLLDRQLSRLLAGFGLSLTVYRTLVTIDSFGEITATDLARHCVLDKGLVSRSVSELSAAGLVEARIDADNRRRKILRLTEAGRARLATVEPAVEARNSAIDALFSESERAAFADMLARVSAHAAADLDGTVDDDIAA